MKELEVFRRFDFDTKTEETNVRGLKNEITATTCSEAIITKEILRKNLNIKFTFIILGVLVTTTIFLTLLSIVIHQIEDTLFYVSEKMFLITSFSSKLFVSLIFFSFFQLLFGKIRTFHLQHQCYL